MINGFLIEGYLLNISLFLYSIELIKCGNVNGVTEFAQPQLSAMGACICHLAMADNGSPDFLSTDRLKYHKNAEYIVGCLAIHQINYSINHSNIEVQEKLIKTEMTLLAQPLADNGQITPSIVSNKPSKRDRSQLSCWPPRVAVVAGKAVTTFTDSSIVDVQVWGCLRAINLDSQ